MAAPGSAAIGDDVDATAADLEVDPAADPAPPTDAASQTLDAERGGPCVYTPWAAICVR